MSPYLPFVVYQKALAPYSIEPLAIAGFLCQSEAEEWAKKNIARGYFIKEGDATIVDVVREAVPA